MKSISAVRMSQSSAKNLYDALAVIRVLISTIHWRLNL
jgi:hypothetical protein